MNAPKRFLRLVQSDPAPASTGRGHDRREAPVGWNLDDLTSMREQTVEMVRDTMGDAAADQARVELERADWKEYAARAETAFDTLQDVLSVCPVAGHRPALEDAERTLAVVLRTARQGANL